MPPEATLTSELVSADAMPTQDGPESIATWQPTLKSVEDFPYTTRYVSELLGLDEAALERYADGLPLTQKREPRTGRRVFTQGDINKIRQVMEQSDMAPTGQAPKTVQPKLVLPNDALSNNSLDSMTQPPQPTLSMPEAMTEVSSAVASNPPLMPMPRDADMAQSPMTMTPLEQPQYRQDMPMPTVPPAASLAHRPSDNVAVASSASGENLAVIIETMSQAKEGILHDLSTLLDEKLAGLDEVVVELIRCKSELDQMKNKVKQLSDDKQVLEAELGSYRPMQFGFYRKD